MEENFKGRKSPKGSEENEERPTSPTPRNSVPAGVPLRSYCAKTTNGEVGALAMSVFNRSQSAKTREYIEGSRFTQIYNKALIEQNSGILLHEKWSEMINCCREV